jgi:hypothetical protein
MQTKLLSIPLAAGLLLGSVGIAMSQSDTEQKQPGQRQMQGGTSGQESGASTPAPGAQRSGAVGQTVVPGQGGQGTSGQGMSGSSASGMGSKDTDSSKMK